MLNLWPPPTATTTSCLRSQGASTSTSPRAQTDNRISPPDISRSQAIRDIIKTPRSSSDQYSGLHEPPLLSNVLDAFMSDCDALNVPENARLSVMYLFLRGDALKHFRRAILPIASTGNEGFQLLAQHYNTHAHQRDNKDEWNTLLFTPLASKYQQKSEPEIL